MISVENLCKVYKFKKKELGLKGSLKNFISRQTEEKVAVNNLSFQIEKGEIVGFLGPNGAGKTTTLKMLSGIMFPTSGNVQVLGYVPWKGENEFKRNISIVLGQKNQLWWDLPANESLYLNKCIYDIPDKQYLKTLDELSELLDVKELLDVQIRNLSLGERMKMELLAALIHKPQVIFLDEPTIGLDLIAQKNIREFLKYYNAQEKISIMLTSHYLADIESLCTRTMVINNGELVYDGSIETIDMKLNEKKIVKLRTVKEISTSPYWKVRSHNNGICTLEIEKKQMKETIAYLLSHFEVNDFSVEDIPLEESLEKIYRMR